MSSFRDLESVCKALGLVEKQTKSGVIWSGIIKSNYSNNGKFSRLSLHIHQQGKDISTGLFRSYVKELHFENTEEFFNFLRKI